jgi:RNA polymerase sigma-70 factor (ECF subfamily)
VDAPSAEVQFVRNRPRLFGLAYRMLGSRADAEDVVQDAWLRFGSAGAAPAASPEALLTTIVTRLSIDRLRAAKAKRETYIGPWLPEPIQTGGDLGTDPESMAVRHEEISLALLDLMEHLSPIERAVFVLHEAMDYSHREIAGIVECSEQASRQHLRRARQHLAGARRFHAAPGCQRRLTEAFVDACRNGDAASLVALLREDCVLWSDGGGKARAALNPIFGSERILRFFAGAATKEPFDSVHLVEANGQAACTLSFEGRVTSVIVLETDGERITELRTVRNPDKLASWARAVALS